MPETSGQPHITTERVRWADVDLVGIMRYSAFTRLVEHAEQEIMRSAGMPYSTLFEQTEFWLPRRQLQIEYFAPARIDDRLTLETYFSRIGTTSITLNVDMRNERGLLVAAASVVVVCVTVADFAKVPLPDELRVKIAPFVITVDGARAAHAVATRVDSTHVR